MDFSLTAPSPASITVAPASVSGPVSFQVTGQGAFDDTVDLSCGNLPAGASCNFTPSASVNPTSSSPVAITLMVSTIANTTAGTFPITINGSVTNGPTKTQALSLTITLDYSLVISNPTLQAIMAPNGTTPVPYKGTLTSLNGYSSLVNLKCAAGATPYPGDECSASPTPQVPTPNGAKFTVEVASSLCSPPNTPPHTPFQFNIVAQGTDSSKTSHMFPVTFTVTSPSQDDFTLEVTPPSNTAPVNMPVQFNGNLMGTVCYDYPVHLSCGSNAPPTCQFPLATIIPSVGGAQFALTVGSDKAATYNFEVAAVGADPNATTHSYPVSFTSTGVSDSGFSFTISPASSILSLPAAQPAIYALDIVPVGGVFPRNAVLAFSGNCPSLSTCSLSSTDVIKGSGNTHVTFTIATTAPVIASAHRGRAFYALLLWWPGLALVFGRLGRRRLVLLFLFAVIVPGLWLSIACGSGLQGNGTGANGQAGTPSGTYIMTVSAKVSSLPQQTASVQLTVN